MDRGFGVLRKSEAARWNGLRAHGDLRNCRTGFSARPQMSFPLRSERPRAYAEPTAAHSQTHVRCPAYRDRKPGVLMNKVSPNLTQWRKQGSCQPLVVSRYAGCCRNAHSWTSRKENASTLWLLPPDTVRKMLRMGIAAPPRPPRTDTERQPLHTGGQTDDRQATSWI